MMSDQELEEDGKWYGRQIAKGSGSNRSETDEKYRAFCAYDHRGRAPGCGWQKFTDNETEAKRLSDEHSGRCIADYEQY